MIFCCYRYACVMDARHCLARQVDVIHRRHGNRKGGSLVKVVTKHPECQGCQQGAALVQLLGPQAARVQFTTGFGGLTRKRKKRTRSASTTGSGTAQLQ